jgi:hypothetical protein
MTDKIKLTLSKPIMAYDKELTELEFRAPNGEDFIACGFPFATEQTKAGTTLTHVNGENLANLIVALAGIPRSSVGQISPRDLVAAFGIVAGFFEVGVTIPPNSSTVTGSLPASTAAG